MLATMLVSCNDIQRYYKAILIYQRMAWNWNACIRDLLLNITVNNRVDYQIKQEVDTKVVDPSVKPSTGYKHHTLKY